MRYTLSKLGLLLCLVLSFSIINSVNAVDTGVVIDPSEVTSLWYKSRLHTLRLGSDATNGLLIAAGGKLKISNGLIAGKNSNVSSSEHAVIGGGNGNRVSANYAGIGGGNSNTAGGKYAVIGGGNVNTANGENSVVVGGDHNTSSNGGVVVGGKSNNGLNGGVVVGGNTNTGYPNSLALGQNSVGNHGSFAWNGEAGSQSAYINATNGTLIGTTSPINGVNLVVNGAVMMGGDDTAGSVGEKGEIRAVGGCFYAFDGVKWHIINRGDEKNYAGCAATLDTAKYCEFGNTVIWHGDTVEAFPKPYGTSCNKVTLTCKDGKLYNGATQVTNYYPYCYVIHR